MRVSTQSKLQGRKFSRRSCRDSNSQPFDHESGVLPTSYPVFVCNAVAITCVCTGVLFLCKRGLHMTVRRKKEEEGGEKKKKKLM